MFPKLMNAIERISRPIITASNRIMIVVCDEFLLGVAVLGNLLPHLLQNISLSSAISAPHWSQYRVMLVVLSLFTIKHNVY